MLKRKRKLDESIIRKDDTIRVVIPEIVERVGYPLNIKNIIDSITPEQLEELSKCLFSIFNISSSFVASDLLNPLDNNDLYKDRIINGIARMMIRQRGWGGKNRSIHVKSVPELKDKMFCVLERKTVKTGTYNPSSGSGPDYWGEYDYEPAYLSNEKTHVLYGIMDPSIITSELTYIEKRCVQKVEYNYKTNEYDPVFDLSLTLG